MKSTTPPVDSFLRSLAAAVVHPGLRSILLFDADMDQFAHAAACVRDLLDAFTYAPVEEVSLGAYHHDEQLWDGASPFEENEARRGMLVQRDNLPAFRLVLIRDVSSLSPEAIRACVQLMDAPVAHLERHGRRYRWTPRLFWLAACRREAAGRVSAHLLDRFALRLNPTGWADGRRERLRASLSERTSRAAPALAAVRSQVVELRRRLRAGKELPAAPVPAVLMDALETLAEIEAPGMRRQLGLARLAVGLARIDDTPLSAAHVAEAAELSGVLRASRKLPNLGAALESALKSTPATAKLEPPSLTERISAPDLDLRLRPGARSTQLEPLGELRTAALVEHLAPASLLPPLPAIAPKPPLSHGFPEDDVPIGREHAPLKRSSREKGGGSGAVIGVRRTSRPEEIAMLPTVLAAAPYQSWRRARANRKGAATPWLIQNADWRAFRRAPTLERMLVLVLDLTSAQDSLFHLVPYLRQAYVERAAVRVVVVGAANASHELRADVVAVRNVLAPELRRALDAGPGRATPLAHGLSIATRITREHCSRGRGPTHGADVVVLSDGLGNVPLEASREGKVKGRVTIEGVEDALRVAEDLRGIKSARVVIIPPRTLRAKRIFASLVEALGAEVHAQARPTGRR